MPYLGMGLLAGAAVAVGLAARSEYEKNSFVTEQFRITSSRIPSGIRRNFVFLTDLHDKQFPLENSSLIDRIRKISPDAVLIGGDMMVSKGKADLSVTVKLLENLTGDFPVFYGNGNHEERMKREREIYGSRYDSFVRELKRLGVVYLSDSGIDLDSYIRITGCNLDEKYYRHRFTVPKLPAGELERHVGKRDSRHYQILLLHSPLFFDECCRWGADLTLCGHFHGGTIRIPFLGGVMTPQYQFFLPWCAGRFDRGEQTMIVGRGLGTHSVNIRLNNRPQLVWITLEGTAEPGKAESRREEEV